MAGYVLSEDICFGQTALVFFFSVRAEHVLIRERLSLSHRDRGGGVQTHGWSPLSDVL